MTDVAKICAPVLAARGFKKRAGGIFTIDVEPGVVLGWLGLNRATKHRAPGEVEVNPVVGVRHQGVERIVAECRGSAFHQYVPPTICMSVGYLMPENRYLAWVFRPEGGTEVAEDLGAALEEHALPFMRAAAPLAALCKHLEGGLSVGGQDAYRRPVALALAGDVDRARADLDRTLRELGDRQSAYDIEFRRFAEAFRKRIDDGL